jgi:hypothetical protein
MAEIETFQYIPSLTAAEALQLKKEAAQAEEMRLADRCREVVEGIHGWIKKACNEGLDTTEFHNNNGYFFAWSNVKMLDPSLTMPKLTKEGEYIKRALTDEGYRTSIDAQCFIVDWGEYSQLR